MKKIEANDPETRSADGITENIAQLKALFPELITEGPAGAAVNVDVLKALVGDQTVTDAQEKYGLNWHGKRAARQLALTPSTGTLRPCPEDSVDWVTTQNLLIEGDNLEVMKLLQKSYAGKVKMIYIDPPYNTGNDFVYPDDFRDNIRNYLQLTGQADGGRKISSNTETSGRFHTDWLNMIYPRLKLAREFLRADGVICISIDDAEEANLRKICDEIFGEENHIATVVWQKRYVSNVTAKWLSDMHDFVIIYAKQKDNVSVADWNRTKAQLSAYKNPDQDPRGDWRAQDLSASKPYSAGIYTITGPTGRQFDPPPNRYWRCNRAQFDAWLAQNKIWWGVDKSARPMLKAFLSETERGITPHTWWDHEFAGHNKEATLELKELFDGDAPFDTPKPVRLMRRIVDLFCTSGDIVMDFFCGSAPLGQAVFEAASEDNSIAVRFILVQLPEKLDRTEFGTIFEVSKERLRRAGKKIRDKQECESKNKNSNDLFMGASKLEDSNAIDLGFRVFKLDSSNIRTWEPDRNNLVQTLLDHQDHLKPGRSESDILFELLLKLGLDLCVPIETRKISNFEVHSIGGGVLLTCLSARIDRAQVETLAQAIVAWHRELAPAGDSTCVFRDSAFADDVAKTNLTEILRQHGIANVRSL